MVSTANSIGGGGVPAATSAPKIILAKPAGAAGGSAGKFGRGDEEPYSRSRLPPGSLCFISDSWDVHPDRILPFMSENTEFTVIGIIGPTGVGKSTILNELYGFDGTTPGMIPPFSIETEEIRAMARHCTVGIEVRITSERLILLDTQPVFSPSVLAEMMRPDGSSAIPVLTEPLSAEIAHELMNIQLGVFLASICNILLVVSEGARDAEMWHLMSTVDLLKQGIPDPSMVPSVAGVPQGQEKEDSEKFHNGSTDFFADLVFVHSKLQEQELSLNNITHLRKALSQYFRSSSFRMDGSQSLTTQSKSGDETENQGSSVKYGNATVEEKGIAENLFILPFKLQEDLKRSQYASFSSMLGKLRDQVLAMRGRPFGKSTSEREWLRNSARIWEKVRRSDVIAGYSKMLHNSGLFRK